MPTEEERTSDGGNLVDPGSGCPTCDERDADRLVWNEVGEQVTCSRCGTTYDPAEHAGVPSRFPN